MWATAKRASCRLLLGEDGDDGRTVNPFAARAVLLKALGAARRQG